MTRMTRTPNSLHPPHACLRVLQFLLIPLLLSTATYSHAADAAPTPDPRPQQTDSAESEFGALFQDNCAVCHGDNLQGASLGSPLVGVELKHGENMPALIESISNGYADKGMPAWAKVFSEQQIKRLALWISEYREGLLYSDFRISNEIEIPAGTVKSELHDFRIETVVADLDPLPYSLAALPDGRILVTEKMRGLRIISAQGEKSELVQGTPATYDDAKLGGGGLEYGMGWLLDVAPHPNYAENGWIYLHYTDRCNDCNEVSRSKQRPVSMNALMRGRIRDNQWVDEEILWKADLSDYAASSDVAAGGRIAFDPEGYVFISIGMQSIAGIQDLSSAHGKVLRLHDDGKVPTDNPYVNDPDSISAIWTYGHRSPQGLEFNVRTGELWETEHGPRGGDEVNLLLPGHNYGWPLFSMGQNYNGTKVEWGKTLGIETELHEVDQPMVDLTPSPAVSSFIFYDGAAFPGWHNSIIVGSLKAADVYRMELVDNKLVHQETLIDNLARIRDIETGINGELLLLLEHASGGQVVRVVPAEKVLATTH